MNFRTRHFIGLVILFNSYNISAQDIRLGFDFGSTYRIDNSSFGYSIDLNFQFKVKQKYRFRVGYGQTFTSKKKPEVLPGFTVLQRDRTNFAPLDVNIGWDDSSFPNASFSPNESVYHNHDFHFLYVITKPKNKLNCFVGPVFSIREHSQIDRYIYALEYDFGAFILEDIAIPVHGYANYLDLGAMLIFRYQLASFGKLDITAMNSLKYYPLNNSIFVDLGVSMMVRL